MKEKTVLITGCSSGFGKAMVNLFLQDGWQVIGTTRQADSLKEFATNPFFHLLAVNVAASEGRQSVCHFIQTKFSNSLNCLINNAGYGLAGPLESLSESQIRTQFEVNFFTPTLLTREMLPALRHTKGSVINVSSVLGYTGMPMQSLYCASKFALEGLSESLAYELKPHGVSVALIEPGGYRTNFAQNMDWPDESDPQNIINQNPAYQKQLNGYRQFMKRISTQGKGNNPETVAKKILNLAQHKSPPLRQRTGSDAQGLYYLRRLLPQKWVDHLLLRVIQHLTSEKAES